MQLKSRLTDADLVDLRADVVRICRIADVLAAREAARVSCDLRQLLARIDREVRARGPPIVAPTRTVGAQRHAKLNVPELMPRFNTEVAFEGSPGSDIVPTAPVLLQLSEEAC